MSHVRRVQDGDWRLFYMQAMRCVEVISLLMQQHLRSLVVTGLEAYLQMWAAYEVHPGSHESLGGECYASVVSVICMGLGVGFRVHRLFVWVHQSFCMGSGVGFRVHLSIICTNQ